MTNLRKEMTEPIPEIPPMVPSAVERATALQNNAFRVLGVNRAISISLDAAYRDGFLTGIEQHDIERGEATQLRDDAMRECAQLIIERTKRDGILYREGRASERKRILALLREPSDELRQEIGNAIYESWSDGIIAKRYQTLWLERGSAALRALVVWLEQKESKEQT